MAQVSYGTITITDTNDISRIYVEYCRSTSNQLSGTTVPNITRAWGETTPPWVDGEYIWQRAVVEKSGTLEKTYGTPVCISGEKGETGEQGPQGGTGAAGRSLKSTETQYTTAAANATITQNNMGNYTWSDNVPTYNTNAPAYWVRITNTYENPTKTVYIIYKDNGITDAVKTSADANATASAANTTAGEAKTQAAAADGKADTAIGTANTANTNATNALNIATGINQHFWTIATDYATGIPAGSYITDTAIDTFKSNKTGGNLLTRSDGIWIRNGVNTLTSLTGTALTFYNPTDNKAQLVIGANGTLQSGNYVRGTNLKFSDSGTKIDLTYGDIITKYFRLSQGVESGINAGAYIYGTIEAIDGKIGSNTTNYWEIGNYTDYLLQPSAKLIGHGSSFIQLGNSGTWRLATNRIHTGWYESGDSYLHFPIFTNGTTNRRWDYGIHVPTSKDDKFLYIRNASSTTDLSNLISDLEDTQNPKVWEYQFYIDGSGNVHAPGFYIGNSTTPIGGGAGTVAERLTQGYGSTTQPIYFNSNGVPTNTTYQLNAAGAKGVDTSISAASTSTNLPTSQAVATFVEGKGYITSYTDNKVQTSQANTTKIYLAGTSTAGTSTGTLNFDSNVYLTTTAGTLHATTFEGNLSGTASRATADGDGNTISTTYLKLSGGNVTGAVSFGSSVSADELTVGDLVVNGSASFTNNLQANTINGVAVGSSPKFTDTNYYHTTGSWGGTNNLTYTATANGGAGALAFTLATATTGAYGVTKLSSATDSTSTTLAATASAVKAAYDLAASKTDNTGTVTSVRVQASSPLQSSSSSASSTTLNTTISFTNQNVNTVLAGPSSGTTAAAPTFRKLVAADIPDISGTYYLASNPSGYTTNTGTVTSVRVQASSPLTSTTNTASNTTLDTTIKFSNQNKNLVLAGPSSGSAAAPTFRSLVADDIPSISKSKISDFPTSLKNPNAIRLNLFNETAARAAANQGTATSYVDYDGSTANQSFSAAGKNALTSIGISGDTLSWVRADGSSGSSTVTITASVASGATVLTDTSGNAISTTGSTTPIYFDGGVPKDVTGVAFSLLPTGTGASNVAVGNHSHGNITNGGDITTTATIASGDRLIINDESESKINNSSITFGTSTTTFLTNKGTWATPVGTTYTFDGTYNASSNKAATVSTVTNAIAALDGGTIGTPSASKTVTAISQTNGNISVTFGDISITKSQISDFPTSMTPAAHTHTFASLTDKPTTLSGYGITDAVQYLGVLSSLGSGTPAAATQTYWVDNIPNNTVKMAYNTSGTEYSLIFSRGGSATYGSVLKWGYNDLYFYIMRKNNASSWKETDWVKMNAGYADNAGTVNGHSVGIDVPSTAKFTDTWNALSTSQAGYVSTAPNDTTKFLRGDATWAAVTKSNVGLGNVENTALSTWTGSNKITTLGTITTGTWNGSAIPVANGGTGATTAANARTNLGLGSAATASTTTSIASGGTGLPTAGTVYTYVTNAISGASNTYVTINTDQTITASQKTFNGAIRWGTASKYGAVNYDSTLEALVFSFV